MAGLFAWVRGRPVVFDCSVSVFSVISCSSEQEITEATESEGIEVGALGEEQRFSCLPTTDR